MLTKSIHIFILSTMRLTTKLDLAYNSIQNLTYCVILSLKKIDQGF